MSKVLDPSSRGAASSDPLTSGSAPTAVLAQPELPSPQAALTPPGPSRVHAFLGGVICGFLLDSLTLVLLLFNAERPAWLALVALLEGGEGIWAIATLLIAPRQRPVRWAAGGVLLGLGLSFLFACILPFYC